jgi:hypothetical protein
MGQTLKIKAGFDRTWDGTLRAQDTGLPTPYPPDATFDAAVARGVGEPTLFAPTLTWIDSSAGTFRISIAASQTAGLDPGVYILQAGVSSGGIRSEAFDGQLEITGVPGSITLRTPYVTAADLAFFYPLLRTIQAYREDDAGFLSRRALASDEFDRTFLERYKHMEKPGFVKRRRPQMETVAGLGFDVADPSAVPPTNAEMAGYLAAGGLLLGSTPRQAPREVREIVSKIAIADLLEGQETTGGRNPYRDEAPVMRAEVEKLWRDYDIQVDVDDDGVPDLLVGSDIVLLS